MQIRVNTANHFFTCPLNTAWVSKVFSKLIFTLFLWLGVYMVPLSQAYATPNLQFNPTATTVVQNDTFQQKILINVDSNNSLSSDAIVNYAGADLEVISVTSGNFFPQFTSANDAGAGRLEIHGYTTAGNSTLTGNGTLATIVFKAKKTSGSSTLSFTCSGGSTNTNILATNGQNILDCAQLNQASVTYGANPTPTPTPTPGPGTPTPTPSGNFTPVCASLYTDISQGTGTPLPVTFTCSGTDTGGYISAAEFTFGDGTGSTIYKNAGSPGSISTTHTYTTIGTLGAQCRVRDNDNVWSSVSDGCKKIIIIRPVPTPTPAKQSGTSGLAGIVTPTPTPAVVSIVSETPTPIPTILPTALPTLAPQENIASSGSTNWLLWSLGLIGLGLGAYLVLRKKKHPQPPPSYMTPVQPPAQPPTPANPPPPPPPYTPPSTP